MVARRSMGRKRRVAVDALGLLLAVVLTAASTQDRDGACPLLAVLRERFCTLTLVWADGGYPGRLVSWAAGVLRLAVTVAKRSDDTRGFVVVPRRWVVERTKTGRLRRPALPLPDTPPGWPTPRARLCERAYLLEIRHHL